MNEYKITTQEVTNGIYIVAAESETEAQHIVSELLLGKDYPNEITDMDVDIISWEFKKVEKV